MKKILLFLSISASLNLFGQPTTFDESVAKVIPFSNKAVKLTQSWVKDREALNIEYLKSLDPDRLLHNFRINAGLLSSAKPLEGWEAPGIGLRGHFVGHYLSAVSSAVEQYNEPLLASRLKYMTDELEKCQQALRNGYLSAFPEKDFDVLEKKFGSVWAPYYTYHKIMQGLLDVYQRTGNKKAYQMVLNMADYVDKRMSRLDSATIEKMLYTTEANPQNEVGAMNEVLYNLYKVSKDPKHLALGKLFDRDWFLNPLSQNKDILSGLHSNTHLVLVNGFAQRYAITREDKYFTAVTNFWDMLIGNHAYVNGSSSGPRPNVTTPTSLTSEHWGNSGVLSNTLTKEIAESCVSHNTQKLSSTLFTWTGNPKYADAYMNTFYNSIMALQSARSGRCVYHLPLSSPRKKSFLKETDFRCCNGTTIEAFSLLNSGIYFHNDASLWINMYIPSKVDWASMGVQLEQHGNLPADSVVDFQLSVKKKTKFSLNFFIPEWATNADIYVNGIKQGQTIQPSSYISLNRQWQHNDQVKIVFHYKLYLKSMPDDKNVISVFYGPTLLAFESSSELILRSNKEKILQHIAPDNINERTFKLSDNGKIYLLRPLFDIDEQSYGVYATIRDY